MEAPVVTEEPRPCEGRAVGMAVVFCLALLLPAPPADAQHSSANAELRGTLGVGAVYLDESPFPALGASVRLYLATRLSVEPEIVHLSDPDYPQTVFLGKVSVDLGRRLYTSVGLGYAWRGGFAGDDGLAWTVRLGWKLLVGERIFIAPEIGGGDPGFVLATVSLGMSFPARHGTAGRD